MSLGIRISCVDCQTYFVPRTNGIYVMETMDDGRPYKIYQADLGECPDCHRQIVYGYGTEPITEHFMDGFEEWKGRVSVIIVGCPRSLPCLRG